jgi:hypothetical protein
MEPITMGTIMILMKYLFLKTLIDFCYRIHINHGRPAARKEMEAAAERMRKKNM